MRQPTYLVNFLNTHQALIEEMVDVEPELMNWFWSHGDHGIRLGIVVLESEDPEEWEDRMTHKYGSNNLHLLLPPEQYQY